jgi:small nuclear ribonucleoprotein (snRNP)-like protein
MRKIFLPIKSFLALLTLATLFGLVTVSAQLSSQGGVQSVPGDNDTTRGELASFDRFMDSHPEIAEQLQRDPSLVTNEEFVERHPALQEYLQQHPGVREEITENPNRFMRQEQRFDRREDRRDNDRRDNDTTRGELASFDRFMDSHPEIAEQLRRDPSLVTNREFVKNHPALQEYLQQHPGTREEITENPDRFMRQEQRFDRREDGRDNVRLDNDTIRGELESFDRFADSHPEIAEQLRRDPSLVKNEEFVEKHPALQEYLQQHPGVREEITENPNGFMRQEQRFDRREDRRDNDTTRGELASFDRFSDSHPEIAEQLRRDPSLVKNEEFVEKHPALQEYLQQHPGVREEITENPNGFMRQEQRFDRIEDNRNHGSASGDMDNFREFLGSHSTLAQQLSNDPRLANSEEFQKNHPELQQFLKAHPGVQEGLKQNPQMFMKSAQQFSGNQVPKTSNVDPKPKQ